MTLQSARQMAENLIEQLKIKKPPVDVVDVAQKLGVPVAFDALTNDEHGEVSGLLISMKGKSLIYVNKNQHVHRQRFSAAHELGHHLLQHNFNTKNGVHVDNGFVINKRSMKSSAGEDYREIEANQFAAALLMPSMLIHQELAQMKRSTIRDVEVEVLAEKFEVSQQAMTIRLDVLRLLK